MCEDSYEMMINADAHKKNMRKRVLGHDIPGVTTLAITLMIAATAKIGNNHDGDNNASGSGSTLKCDDKDMIKNNCPCVCVCVCVCV